MGRVPKAAALLLPVLLLGCKIATIRPLEPEGEARDPQEFDAATYVDSLWEEDLPAALDQAVDLRELLPVLEAFGVVVYFTVGPVIVIALLAGAAMGAINGLLVARLRVAPFIATLGMLYVARGFALLISNGATFPNLQGSADLGNTGFVFLGAGSILGLPEKQSVDCLLVTSENVDRFGLFELLPESGAEADSASE